ncbi:MAG: hypothetical protein ABI792_08090 [bacterium]
MLISLIEILQQFKSSDDICDPLHGWSHSQAALILSMLQSICVNAKLKLDWIKTDTRSIEKYFEKDFIT